MAQTNTIDELLGHLITRVALMAYFVIIIAQYIAFGGMPSWSLIFAKAIIVVIITYFINDLFIKNNETFLNIFIVATISYLAYDFMTLQFGLIDYVTFAKTSIPFAAGFGIITSSLYAMVVRKI